MKKLTQKAETFQILWDAGKSMHDAYKLVGFKGNSEEKNRGCYSITL